MFCVFVLLFFVWFLTCSACSIFVFFRVIAYTFFVSFITFEHIEARVDFLLLTMTVERKELAFL